MVSKFCCTAALLCSEGFFDCREVTAGVAEDVHGPEEGILNNIRGVEGSLCDGETKILMKVRCTSPSRVFSRLYRNALTKG
jgi:hypothetical protein